MRTHPGEVASRDATVSDDAFRQLQSAKPRLFSPSATKIRLQTVAVLEDKTDSLEIITDVVVRNQDFEDCLQVGKKH